MYLTFNLKSDEITDITDSLEAGLPNVLYYKVLYVISGNYTLS